MKFEICRTSGYTGDVEPCTNAFTEGDPPWPNKEMKQWLIEINSLEDLIKFSKDNGDALVLTTWDLHVDNNLFPSLEIYDDYRE